jgi:hypothetical protein
LEYISNPFLLDFLADCMITNNTKFAIELATDFLRVAIAKPSLARNGLGILWYNSWYKKWNLAQIKSAPTLSIKRRGTVNTNDFGTPSAGIEPTSQEPESYVLSVAPRGHDIILYSLIF